MTTNRHDLAERSPPSSRRTATLTKRALATRGLLHDNPNATGRFLGTGHIALETHLDEIAYAMR